MGGDQSPLEIFEAVKDVCATTDYRLVVFATHPLCSSLSEKLPLHAELFGVEDAIEMDEPPLLAVRRKKNSSMAAGMRLLNEGKLDAFISTGSTGALVATSSLHLKKLPGIERPALLVAMPTAVGEVVVLDVGAGVLPKPYQLVTYAKLGSFYRQIMHGLKGPKIGLLNIGAEEQKGTKELKEAYRLLKESFGQYFLGNTEGREVFQGKVDVLVTDGFTGNVFLKTSEGISRFLVDYLSQEFGVPEIISHLHQRFNYTEHPGAFLCGVEGLVIKCHGYSDRAALVNGIRGAAILVEHAIVSKIKDLLLKRTE